jgi:hypothetical protein
VHGVPFGGVGIILVKQVVLTLIEAEAVGVSSPVIKCKKTPREKCRFVAEEAKKR